MRAMKYRVSAPKIVRIYLAAILVFAGVAPSPVVAAEVLDRSVNLSTAAPSASANYAFNFSAPSATVIQSFEAEVCEEAAGVCDVPAGFASGSATLLNQPTGFGDTSGWSIDTSVVGVIRMNNPTNVSGPAASQSVTFGNITNPSAPNTAFFIRITTYSDDNYTDEIDTGVVAVSTSNTLLITGFVPPILTFCVGVTIPGDCSTATGDTLNLGTFSPSVTAFGTSQMRASTNAGDGYAITIEGTTLSSGSNTISAMNTRSQSQTGIGQFGINLRDNSNPNSGAQVTGSGNGLPTTDYGTVDEFMFNDGDTIATAPGPTDANTFTATYITNIPPSQAAGNYSTTVTYIATATF